MKKPAQVVMLPTNEKATVNSIVTRPSDNRMAIVNVLTKDDPQPCIHQHLYILSDEEIKEGDWCYDEYNKVIFQNNSSGTPGASKKIIATTDRFLKVFIHTTMAIDMDDCYESLPQPSQSFIEHFVDEYNKGNVITDVMVEYDEGKFNLDELRERHLKRLPHSYDYCNLKINPKDNTITIRKVKDSWSREEVIELLQNCWSDSATNVVEQIKQEEFITFNKWIEENL